MNPEEMGIETGEGEAQQVASAIEKIEAAQSGDNPEAFVEAVEELQTHADALVPQSGDTPERTDAKARVSGFLREVYWGLTGGEMGKTLREFGGDVRQAFTQKDGQESKAMMIWRGYWDIANKWGLPAAVRKIRGQE